MFHSRPPEAGIALVNTKNQPLALSDFLYVRRVFVSYFQPIKFVRFGPAKRSGLKLHATILSMYKIGSAMRCSNLGK